MFEGASLKMLNMPDIPEPTTSRRRRKWKWKWLWVSAKVRWEGKEERNIIREGRGGHGGNLSEALKCIWIAAERNSYIITGAIIMRKAVVYGDLCKSSFVFGPHLRAERPVEFSSESAQPPSSYNKYIAPSDCGLMRRKIRRKYLLTAWSCRAYLQRGLWFSNMRSYMLKDYGR